MSEIFYNGGNNFFLADSKKWNKKKWSLVSITNLTSSILLNTSGFSKR